MCGIGHTRWATHGKPEERNAHPHLDGRGCWQAWSWGPQMAGMRVNSASRNHQKSQPEPVTGPSVAALPTVPLSQR
jgi:hypothetical protein